MGLVPVTGNSLLLGRNRPAALRQCHALGSSSASGHWERKAEITVHLPTKVPLSQFCNSQERSNIPTQPEAAEHCLAAGNPLEIHDHEVASSDDLLSQIPRTPAIYKCLDKARVQERTKVYNSRAKSPSWASSSCQGIQKGYLLYEDGQNWPPK